MLSMTGCCHAAENWYVCVVFPARGFIPYTVARLVSEQMLMLRQQPYPPDILVCLIRLVGCALTCLNAACLGCT